MDPLWITYAWKDDEGGDFSYLVQELEAEGVPITYDKIALVPGRRLWEQIANKITSSPLSGWASLLTPNSLLRPGCGEELAYALDRALKTKGEEFPLIGLLHDVSIDDVPTALRVRLCVNLEDPDWREQVLAGVEGRAPKRSTIPLGPYVVQIHSNYMRPGSTAIEARPRFGSITYWRFAVPKGATVVAHGAGPANGGGVSGITMNSVEGQITIDGVECAFYGAGNALSASTSAYIVLQGNLPDFVLFGQASQPFGGIEQGVRIPLR